MALSYYRTYKVPMWILINLPSEQKRAGVVKFLQEAGAFNQEWPSTGFAQTLFSFKSRGYDHAIPASGKFVIDSTLLTRAASEHVKKVISEQSQLGGSVGRPSHQLNRVINDNKDIERLMNELLNLEDEVALSQIFQIQERCFNEDSARNTKAFYTIGADAPKNVLTKVANKVITIGEGTENDIDITGLSKKQASEKIEQFFIENN